MEYNLLPYGSIASIIQYLEWGYDYESNSTVPPYHAGLTYQQHEEVIGNDAE